MFIATGEMFMLSSKHEMQFYRAGGVPKTFISKHLSNRSQAINYV